MSGPLLASLVVVWVLSLSLLGGLVDVSWWDCWLEWSGVGCSFFGVSGEAEVGSGSGFGVGGCSCPWLPAELSETLSLWLGSIVEPSRTTETVLFGSGCAGVRLFVSAGASSASFSEVFFLFRPRFLGAGTGSGWVTPSPSGTLVGGGFGISTIGAGFESRPSSTTEIESGVGIEVGS